MISYTHFIFLKYASSITPMFAHLKQIQLLVCLSQIFFRVLSNMKKVKILGCGFILVWSWCIDHCSISVQIATIRSSKLKWERLLIFIHPAVVREKKRAWSVWQEHALYPAADSVNDRKYGELLFNTKSYAYIVKKKKKKKKKSDNRQLVEHKTK